MGTTSPFTLTSGVTTLTLADDDPNVQLTVGTDKVFFLAADLAADSATAVPDTFRATHILSASSTGEMASTHIPLLLESQDDVASSSLEINAPPELTAAIGDQTATEGEAYILDVASSFTESEGRP